MVKTTFAHIALNCRDMAATERFYSRHFGFRRARVIDLGADKIVFLKSGSMYLELFRATETSPAPQPKNDGPAWPGVRHFAFQVADVDAKLAEIGTDAQSQPRPARIQRLHPRLEDRLGSRPRWQRGRDQPRLRGSKESACRAGPMRSGRVRGRLSRDIQ